MSAASMIRTSMRAFPRLQLKIWLEKSPVTNGLMKKPMLTYRLLWSTSSQSLQ